MSRRSARNIFPPGLHKSRPYPPESLTVDQVRYALSQWFLSLRYGRRTRRIILQDAAAWIADHRRHNTEAKLCHTRTMRKKLENLRIEVDRIRSCLASNLKLYCYQPSANSFQPPPLTYPPLAVSLQRPGWFIPREADDRTGHYGGAGRSDPDFVEDELGLLPWFRRTFRAQICVTGTRALYHLKRPVKAFPRIWSGVCRWPLAAK